MNRMIKRILRIVGLGLLAVIGLTLAILAVLAVYKPLTQRILVQYLQRRTELTIAVRKLDYRLFPLNVEVTGLKVSGEVEALNISLAIGYVEARGDWRRLFQKDKAVFDSIRIDEVGLKLQIAKTGNLRVDWKSLAETLNRLGPLEIKDVALNMSFPGLKVDILQAELAFRRADGLAEYNYVLRAGKVGFEALDRKSYLSGSLESSGKLELGERPALQGEMVAYSLRFAWPESEVLLPEPIKIKARCEYDEMGKTFNFGELDVDATPLFHASGPMELSLGETFSGRGSSLLSFSDIAPALERLKPYLPPYLAALDATGGATVRGDWHYSPSPMPQLDLRLDLAFQGVALSLSRPELTADAVFSGNLAIKGVVPGLQASGRLKFGKGSLRVKGLAVNNISAELQVERKGSLIAVPEFKGKAMNLIFSLRGEKWALNKLAVEGRGSLETQKKRISLTSLRIQSLELPLFLAEARTELIPRAKKYLRFESPHLDIQKAADLLRPILPVEMSAWQPDGDFGLEAEVEENWTPERSWSSNGRLSFHGLKLENPSLSLTGEGLTPDLRFSGVYAVPDRRLSFSLSLLLDHGEVLWREIYHDWSAGSLRTEIKGVLMPADRQVLIQEAGLSIEPFGRLQASGSLRGRAPLSFDLQVSGALPDPSAVLSLLSGRPGNGAGPLSFGGDWSAECRLKKGGGLFSAAGNVAVQNGRVEESQALILLSGLDARLPFHIVMGSADAGGGVPDVSEAGHIRALEFRTPFLTISPFSAEVKGGANSWLLEPISFDAWGGRAIIGRSRFSFDPGPGQFRGRSSLSLSDGMIERLIPLSDGFNLSGRVSLDLPSVEITLQEISTEGEAMAKVFSGEVVARRLRIERPLSRGRVIAGDIVFSGLDLEKMTDTLPFGRVTGIVDGEINDLAFSYGQPERFDLRLESVKKRGIKQTFSLKAVDDLTILSQGAGPVPSQAFFLRFVPAFPYEKLGISCSLRNDVFTLHGLIREQGIEYLVRRAWPFGINIINRDPSRQISFKDMVGRLKRISASESR
jgi:hypothetical protein